MKKVGSLKLNLIALLFLAIGTAGFPSSARAYTSWPDLIGPSFGTFLNQMWNTIDKVIVDAAQKAAVTAVADEVFNNVSTGADGSPMWITDWRKTLSTEPEQVTQLQVKNFLTKVGGGRNSNYVAAGGGAGSGGIISNVENAVLDMSVPELVNLAEYGVNNPSEIFTQGNFRAFFSAYGSSGNNVGNQAELTMLVQSFKDSAAETNRRLAEVQAITYGGYGASSKDGKVITPGSSIRDIVAKAQGLSFDMLANADSIGQVVSAVVAKVVSKAVHKGIGNAKEAINRDYGSTISTAQDVYQTYQSATTAYGNINQ